VTREPGIVRAREDSAGISYVAAVAYVFYAWYTYSGFYRMFAVWHQK